MQKELPKLDRLYDQTSRDQLKIILINIEKKKFEDIQSFLDNLSIKNLTSYFDNDLNLTREFGLRGIPITLIVNSDKKEVARVIGDLDFTDPNLLNGLSLISYLPVTYTKDIKITIAQN